MNVYDRHYRKESYFGEPFAPLKELFKKRGAMYKKGTVLDLGAGQGRDSLFISDLGFQVTAVDTSSIGLGKIREGNSAIKTVQADLYDFDLYGYDYILLDGILNFYQKNFDKESKLVNRICAALPSGGVIIICMPKSLRTERIFKQLMGDSTYKFKIIAETYTEYPEFDSDYYFIALQKL